MWYDGLLAVIRVARRMLPSRVEASVDQVDGSEDLPVLNEVSKPVWKNLSDL